MDLEQLRQRAEEDPAPENVRAYIAALRERAEQDPTVDNVRAWHDGIALSGRALDAAIGDGNDGTEEQQQLVADLSDEIDRAGERLEQAERRQRLRDSRERWRSTQFGSRVEPHADGLNVRSLTARESRDRALALLDRENEAPHLRSDQRERAERLIRAASGDVNGAIIAQRLLLTEHPDYREAFMRLVTRSHAVLTPEQSRAVEAFDEFRAMSIGTDTAGGFGVPVLIDPTIILTAQGHPNDILGLARVETITTDAWRGVTSAGVTWTFKAEAAEATDDSPTLAQPVVTTHRADGYIPYSIEVGMDYPGFADEMQRLLASGYAELLVEKLTTGAGDGSEEPFGILTALDANATVEVALDTAGTVTADDINGLWAALPMRYRNPALANTAWMMHTQVDGVIQQLGQDMGAAFTVNFTAEGITVLKGRRNYENDYFDTLPAGVGAANLVVVGDWMNYLVAQRAGMSIEFIPQVFHPGANRPSGERAWFAWARVGADSVNDLGFRLLQNPAA